MGFISFNKTPKHQRFNYIPRYYDADKEDLDERVRLAKGEAGDADLAKSRIRSGFKRRSRAGSTSNSAKSAIRLFLIIAILVLFTYMILTSDSILNLIESFAG
jgi:hypothetical protein